MTTTKTYGMLATSAGCEAPVKPVTRQEMTETTCVVDPVDPDVRPTAVGFLYTCQDGSRAYVLKVTDRDKQTSTVKKTIAERMLHWGWPLHPGNPKHWRQTKHRTGKKSMKPGTEYWAKETGTCILSVPREWPLQRLLHAEYIAALPVEAYRAWEHRARHGSKRERAYRRRVRNRRKKCAQKCARHSQRKMDKTTFHPYMHERWVVRGHGKKAMRVPATPMKTWRYNWHPDLLPANYATMKPKARQAWEQELLADIMARPDFSDWMRSGSEMGYDQYGNPMNNWFRYTPPPLQEATDEPDATDDSGAGSEWGGKDRVSARVYARDRRPNPTPGTPEALGAPGPWDHHTQHSPSPAFARLDGSFTIAAAEGAADAAPLFPALVRAWEVGDDNHAKGTRVARIERMLTWLGAVYGPLAEVEADEYLRDQCKDYETSRTARHERIKHRGPHQDRQNISPTQNCEICPSTVEGEDAAQAAYAPRSFVRSAGPSQAPCPSALHSCEKVR